MNDILSGYAARIIHDDTNENKFSFRISINCKPARMVPKVAGGRAANTAHQIQPFFFIQIAVDGESVRRRFSAPHQFAANAQEQIALRRMCRNEQ